MLFFVVFFFVFQAEDGIRDLVRSRGLGDVYKRQGAAAGQTVPHLHIHLIPRYPLDRDDPRGGVRWVIPEKAKYWP